MKGAFKSALRGQLAWFILYIYRISRGVNYSENHRTLRQKSQKILLNPRIPKSQEMSKNCIKYLEKAQYNPQNYCNIEKFHQI